MAKRIVIMPETEDTIRRRMTAERLLYKQAMSDCRFAAAVRHLERSARAKRALRLRGKEDRLVALNNDIADGYVVI